MRKKDLGREFDIESTEVALESQVALCSQIDPFSHACAFDWGWGRLICSRSSATDLEFMATKRR